MAFDDLPLRPATPPPAPPPPANAGPTRWVVLGAAAVIVGALLVWWWMGRTQPETATPAPTTATDVAVGSNRPKRQPIDLPSLDASDDLLRQLVSALSSRPLVARLLATQGLVRGATLAVVQIGDGRTPSTPLAVLRPLTHAGIVGSASGRIDPASYARWNQATAALTSIDTGQLAQLYVNVEPLFDQAYHELGHPGVLFDEAIVRAINTLASTPEVPADAVLLKRPGYYEYSDASLRALLPVQKQFVLFGPDNRRTLMSWLRQLASNLDLKVD
jgi:Protein of unknown function (DUF3014)